MAIRVLRLIEYIFNDEKTMSDNMARFTINYKTPTMEMRSAILTPTFEPLELKCDRCGILDDTVSIRDFCSACGPVPLCSYCFNEHLQETNNSNG